MRARKRTRYLSVLQVALLSLVPLPLFLTSVSTPSIHRLSKPNSPTPFGKQGVGIELGNNAALDDAVNYWMKQYDDWHTKERSKAKRVAVFRPVPAGLGDNVIGMINLWGYSVLTRRVFLLDIPTHWSEMLSDNAKKYLYTTADEARLGQPRGFRIRLSPKEPMYTSAKRLLNGTHPNVALRISVSDSPSSLAPEWGVDNVPRFTTDVKRAIARKLLEPSDAVQTRIETVRKRCGLPQLYVGMHARLGGVGETTLQRFAKLSGNHDQIARCFARFARRLAAKYQIRPAVFLATDTESFRGKFEKAIRRISPDASVCTMDGEIEHFHRAHETKLLINMHAENILLGDAVHIFGFRSGFSEIARWRGKARQIDVVPMFSCDKET